LPPFGFLADDERLDRTAFEEAHRPNGAHHGVSAQRRTADGGGIHIFDQRMDELAAEKSPFGGKRHQARIKVVTALFSRRQGEVALEESLGLEDMKQPLPAFRHRCVEHLDLSMDNDD